jgi:hypothetical protein
MLLIQVLIVGFALYALGRTLMRFRRHTIALGELLLWSGFWAAVGVFVMAPGITQWFAGILGVGRGADAVFYVSIVALSYAFFRIYLRSRQLEQQLTLLVRKLAIEKHKAEDEAEESGSS